MTTPPRYGKRDSTESAIVDALRRIGCLVERTNDMP